MQQVSGHLSSLWIMRASCQGLIAAVTSAVYFVHCYIGKDSLDPHNSRLVNIFKAILFIHATCRCPTYIYSVIPIDEHPAASLLCIPIFVMLSLPLYARLNMLLKMINEYVENATVDVHLQVLFPIQTLTS